MNKKIRKLKTYKEILIMCKKIQIINKIDEDIENRIPTYGWDKTIKKREKQKILSLY